MDEFPNNVNAAEMLELAAALRAGRIRPPFAAIALQTVLPRDMSGLAASALESLRRLGATTESIAAMLVMLAAGKHANRPVEDAIDLVTTGPEVASVSNRDTSAVVRELFANARSSVLVVGYAVYQGKRVFQALAERMMELPGLQVRFFLDIQRGHTDTSAPSEIVRRFADRFRSTQWPPECPLPRAFYYPASLEMDRQRRASLHAKCVVVDRESAFISSANFTEAAQEKNIEVGVLVRSQTLATGIECHFEALAAEGMVVPLDFGPSA